MIAKLTTLLANISLCYAACVGSEIRQIQNPPREITYSPPYVPPFGPDAPRLLLIGDVHGMLSELEQLLEKTEFSASRGDRVIFVGDMINKGPESSGVVELGMRIGAASVRGNHEDRVLRTWAGAEIARAAAEANGSDAEARVSEYEDGLSEGELAALEVARTLTPEQRAWSAALPLVLRLGNLPGLGETVVVHAGMTPSADIDNQDPWAMYNVRTLLELDGKGQFINETYEAEFEEAVEARLRDMEPWKEPSSNEIDAEKERQIKLYGGSEGGFVPVDTNGGKWWVEAWNEVEKAKPEGGTLSVIYGHDSKRGINIRDYTYGTDSRCVNGGKLTALVLEPDDSESLKHYLVDVDCEEGEMGDGEE